MRVILLVVLAIICIDIHLVHAQQEQPLPVSHFPYEIYTAKDGLSQTLVHYIAQDNDGNIWTGAREGINKFDGIKFSNHRTSSRYPDDVLRKVLAQKNGDIWIAGQKGFHLVTQDSSYFFDVCPKGPYNSGSIFLNHLGEMCLVCSGPLPIEKIIFSYANGKTHRTTNLPFSETEFESWNFHHSLNG